MAWILISSSLHTKTCSMNGLRRSEPHRLTRLGITCAMRSGMSRVPTITAMIVPLSERVFIVDVNGDVFNVVESSEPEFCYGNLFYSTVREIAASDGRARLIQYLRSGFSVSAISAHISAIAQGFSWPTRPASSAKYWRQAAAPYAPCLTTYFDVFKRADLNDFILESYSSDDDAASAKAHPAMSVA